MNREGAETFLRLLAEAQLRDQLAPDPHFTSKIEKIHGVSVAIAAVSPRISNK
jgi:hypothetical protein